MTKVDLGTPYLDAHVDKRVIHVRINRVERRNAMTLDMYRGLRDATILADGDPEIDAVCVRGTGDWFCVGGDMSGNQEDSAAIKERDPTVNFPFRHFESCRKIVVAAVNGACHAGGLNILMHSDISVAVDTAVFRGPELLRGIPDPYMSGRLAQHVGLAKAKYMMFTAALIKAREAEAMGLLGNVVAAADFDAEVERVLEQICATAPQARAMIKADLNDRLPRHDHNMFKHSMMNPEMIEGMTAFIEKRTPEWPRE
ncbi:MAG: enoyl-CoA hydratase/isomerase family protein [Myxococcota bacterium]|jgi:enoyl-CoA hydratase